MSQSSLKIFIWTKSLINRKKLTRPISRISIEMEGEEGESSAQDLTASLSQKVPLKDLDVEKGSILNLRYLLNVRAQFWPAACIFSTQFLKAKNVVFKGRFS